MRLSLVSKLERGRTVSGHTSCCEYGIQVTLESVKTLSLGIPKELSLYSTLYRGGMG